MSINNTSFFSYLFSPNILCWCSLLTHLLVKICPAFRIQSLKLTYHIGLSIQQETKKQGQNYCYEKGTDLTVAVGWGEI